MTRATCCEPQDSYTENVVIIAKDLESHMGSRDYWECCGRRPSYVGTGALQRQVDHVERGLGRCDKLQSKKRRRRFHRQRAIVQATLADSFCTRRLLRWLQARPKVETHRGELIKTRRLQRRRADGPTLRLHGRVGNNETKKNKTKWVQSRGPDRRRQSNESSVLHNEIIGSRIDLSVNPGASGCRVAAQCMIAS